MRNQLHGGVATGENSLYVLFPASTADEDDRLIASGRVEGTSVRLRKRKEVPDVVSLIALSGKLQELGEAAAMTGEGKVVFFSEGSAREEQIPGAGYSAEGARKLGRMTKLKQPGDDLIAVGYGGQAYIRDTGGTWRYLEGPPTLPSRPNTKLCFFSVIRWDDSLYFAGTERTDFEDTPEIEAADEADDSDLWADLILAAAVPDRTTLWKYDGDWTQVEIDYPGTITEMLPYQGAVLLFTTNGRIISTADFDELNDVFSFSRKGSFWDIKLLQPDVVVLFNDALWVWSDNLEEFNPSLPPNDDSYINVWGTRASAFAFAPSRILHLRDGIWTDVSYTLE
jgi:hypothetical protein